MSSPIWGSWPDIYYSLTATVFFSGALSLTRGSICLLYILLALASVVFLESESLGTRDHILLSQIWGFPYRSLLRLAGSWRRYLNSPPHGCHLLPNQSQSYATTDSQSASVSWCQAPIWGLRPDFITVRQLQVCWCGALSLTRERVCRLQLGLVLASVVILGSESRGTRDHILLPQIWDSFDLEGQFHVFISPRNRVAQIYPPALGSLFVASYDSQGYGGGIRTGLQAGLAEPRYIDFARTTHRKRSSSIG
jgi:hypothetical protein